MKVLVLGRVVLGRKVETLSRWGVDSLGVPVSPIPHVSRLARNTFEVSPPQNVHTPARQRLGFSVQQQASRIVGE